MSSVALIGVQWGDEGKGKIIDVLTEQSDIVVRFQGGANAGHTVEIGDENGEHLSDFHNDDSGDISGVVHRYSAMITIPDSLMMDMFYLHFTVSDMSGKSSTEKVMLHINEDVHNHTH